MHTLGVVSVNLRDSNEFLNARPSTSLGQPWGLINTVPLTSNMSVGSKPGFDSHYVYILFFFNDTFTEAEEMHTLGVVSADLRASNEFLNARPTTAPGRPQGWMNTVPLTSNMSVVSKRSSMTRKSGEVGVKYAKEYMKRRNLILSLLVCQKMYFYIPVRLFVRISSDQN